MSSIPDSWFQGVAEDIRIPNLRYRNLNYYKIPFVVDFNIRYLKMHTSPALSKVIAPVIEVEVKKIIQQSDKFRRHGKARAMTVDHINLALRMNQAEEVYGLGNKLSLKNKDQMATTSFTIEASKVDLLELAKQPLPRCPLAPDLNMHWLAVHGTQPRIPENPVVSVLDSESQPSDLPKEMQFFYSRATASILALDKSTLPAVFQSFETDPGLQDLLPFLSLFIYRQIKNTTRSLPLLTCLVQATRSLIANPHLRHEFHLHQLVPVILTCVIGANLSISTSNDHWELRQMAAGTIAVIVKRLTILLCISLLLYNFKYLSFMQVPRFRPRSTTSSL
jgi:transcription initiation factor TFIID subunit 6